MLTFPNITQDDCAHLVTLSGENSIKGQWQWQWQLSSSLNYSSGCDPNNLLFCSEVGRHLPHALSCTSTCMQPHTTRKHGQTVPAMGKLFDWWARMGCKIWVKGQSSSRYMDSFLMTHHWRKKKNHSVCRKHALFVMSIEKKRHWSQICGQAYQYSLAVSK